MEAGILERIRHERARTVAELLADDRVVSLLLFGIAVLLYAPGVMWGLPYATAPDLVVSWGSDELGPLGPLAELHAVLLSPSPVYNPQYPLFHYVVQAMFIAPYLAWLKLTGGLASPDVMYPFGLADPVGALRVMGVLTRVPSLLMGAGTVVAAFHTARITWDRRTGIVASIFVLLLYPAIYYARTSNVDAPALFWTAVGFAIIAYCLRHGLDGRRAFALGVMAALATATKDASAFAFIAGAMVLVPWHLRSERRAGILAWPALRPLVVGLAVTAVVYVVASGLAIEPARFRSHWEWVTGTTASFVYPSTVVGTLGLLREIVGHVEASMGLPVAILVVGGLVLCIQRRNVGLWLVLPAAAVIVGTILPLHFVNFRYVLLSAYCLTFFAAYATTELAGTASRPRALAVGAFVLAVTWSLVRGIDLTYQMMNDSRYAVGEWMAANVNPGDRIAYFGAVQKLPPLAAGVVTIPETHFCSRADWQVERPDFVLVIPQQHFEIVHELTLSEEAYQALLDGSLGYRRVVQYQTRGLSSRRAVPWVNPPVQVYARADRVAALRPPQLASVGAILEGLEARLGLEPRAPTGLVRNVGARTTEFCRGVPW